MWMMETSKSSIMVLLWRYRDYFSEKGEKFISNNYSLIWLGIGNTRRADISLAVHKGARNTFISYNDTSDRLLVETLRQRYGKFIVFVCCAPTNKANHDVRDQFYIDLAQLISSALPQDILLLLGDFNTTVSDRTDIWENVMGLVTLDVTNDKEIVFFNSAVPVSLLYPKQFLKDLEFINKHGIVTTA